MPTTSAAAAQLTSLRGVLDVIDDHLIALLALRMDTAREIADAKAAGQLAAYQPSRHAAVLRRAGRQASRYGLDQGYVTALFELITAETVVTQQRRLAPVGPGTIIQAGGDPT